MKDEMGSGVREVIIQPSFLIVGLPSHSADFFFSPTRITHDALCFMNSVSGILLLFIQQIFNRGSEVHARHSH